MRDLSTWIFQIPLNDIQSDSYDECGNKNPCICCGKEVKGTKYMVHLLTTGNLISSQEDFEESQGFFPIGNACKNKLPNNFYFKQ
jgi:hypothetical protein